MSHLPCPGIPEILKGGAELLQSIKREEGPQFKAFKIVCLFVTFLLVPDCLDTPSMVSAWQ